MLLALIFTRYINKVMPFWPISCLLDKALYYIFLTVNWVEILKWKLLCKMFMVQLDQYWLDLHTEWSVSVTSLSYTALSALEFLSVFTVYGVICVSRNTQQMSHVCCLQTVCYVAPQYFEPHLLLRTPHLVFLPDTILSYFWVTTNI